MCRLPPENSVPDRLRIPNSQGQEYPSRKRPGLKPVPPAPFFFRSAVFLGRHEQDYSRSDFRVSCFEIDIPLADLLLPRYLCLTALLEGKLERNGADDLINDDSREQERKQGLATVRESPRNHACQADGDPRLGDETDAKQVPRFQRGT